MLCVSMLPTHGKQEENKGDLSKAKGKMLLCGYRAVDVPDAMGRVDGGQFGLELRPRDRRIVWQLRCDSVQERRQWKHAFKVRGGGGGGGGGGCSF